MTRIEAKGEPASERRRSDPDSRSKSVLFCPVCGHESGIGDDWNLRLTDGDRAGECRELICPDCDAVVVNR